MREAVLDGAMADDDGEEEEGADKKCSQAKMGKWPGSSGAAPPDRGDEDGRGATAASEATELITITTSYLPPCSDDLRSPVVESTANITLLTGVNAIVAATFLPSLATS